MNRLDQCSRPWPGCFLAATVVTLHGTKSSGTDQRAGRGGEGEKPAASIFSLAGSDPAAGPLKPIRDFLGPLPAGEQPAPALQQMAKLWLAGPADPTQVDMAEKDERLKKLNCRFLIATVPTRWIPACPTCSDRITEAYQRALETADYVIDGRPPPHPGPGNPRYMHDNGFAWTRTRALSFSATAPGRDAVRQAPCPAAGNRKPRRAASGKRPSPGP